MGYVALSRIRSLSGLKLMGLNDTALTVNPKILLVDKKLREWSDEVRALLENMPDALIERKHKTVLFNRFGGKVGGRKEKEAPKKPTVEITRDLFERGLSLDEVTKKRNMVVSTILGHLEQLKERGTLPDISHIKPREKDFDIMADALRTSAEMRLAPARKKLKNKYSYRDLRIARLFL